MIINYFSYYDQFASVNLKMPFREGVGVNASFTWKCSLNKNKSFLKGTPKIS